MDTFELCNVRANLSSPAITILIWPWRSHLVIAALFNLPPVRRRPDSSASGCSRVADVQSECLRSSSYLWLSSLMIGEMFGEGHRAPGKYFTRQVTFLRYNKAVHGKRLARWASWAVAFYTGTWWSYFMTFGSVDLGEITTFCLQSDVLLRLCTECNDEGYKAKASAITEKHPRALGAASIITRRRYVRRGSRAYKGVISISTLCHQQACFIMQMELFSKCTPV